MGTKTKKHQDSEVPARLLSHLRELGLRDASDYQRWCREHGFGSGLNKPKKMLARELRRADAIAKARAEEFIRCRNVPVRKHVLAIATGRHAPTPYDQQGLGRFASFVKFLFENRSSRCPASERSSLVRLVEHLLSVRCKFLDESNCQRSLGDNGISLLESLALVATYRAHWIRPLEHWKPRTRNALRQFHSLLRHLFDRYGEVPAFMDQAWAIGRTNGGTMDVEGEKYRRWYLHIGAGRSAKELDFPISMTKPIVRHYLRAPDGVSIPRAVRWAQVRGMNGHPRLADAVLATRLAEDFRHDDFWVTVIRWLIDQPLLDTVHVLPIIDYVHHRRFVPAHRLPAGDDDIGPPEPNLTMRGRSARSLLRQVDRWHRQLSGSNRFQLQDWSASGIGGFELAEGKETSEKFRIWTIRELLGTKALVVEGRALNHCVATYASSCARRATSIWTLEVESYAGIEKRITIEVNLQTRTIVQARGKMNRTLTEQERGVLRRWCAVAGLKISSYV